MIFYGFQTLMTYTFSPEVHMSTVQDLVYELAQAEPGQAGGGGRGWKLTGGLGKARESEADASTTLRG